MSGEAPPPVWLFALFPILFALFWTLITALLGHLSGWFRLQRHFPCDDDAPLLRLRLQSGRLGLVNFNRVLTLDACRAGLRVRVLSLLGPFQRPFQVPWDQIDAEPFRRFLTPMVRLDLGRPQVAQLILTERTWTRLNAAGRMTR